MKNKSRRSIIVIAVFIIGIIAVAWLLLISIAKKYSPIFLGAESLVLVCLIYLLTSTLISRKRIIEQDLERARSPYGKVDKKEIDKIFDMIDKEEQRRGRSMVYASPDAKESGASGAAFAESSSAEAKSASESTPAEEEDDDRLPIIFPDQDEYEGDSKASSPASEDSSPTNEEHTEDAAQQTASDEIAELAAAAALGTAVGVISQDGADTAETANGRKPKGKSGKGGKHMDNRPKKRQPPIYYDQYGRPVAAPQRQASAQPVGYDQYGRPIYAQRPAVKKPRPIGFDQNGAPIFAAPSRKPRPIGFDQYGRPIYPPTGRPRPAGGRAPQRRKPAQGAVPGAEQAAASQAQQIPTEPMAASAADALAAIEANAASGANTYYDEDYIPVVVHMEEDFDYYDDRYTPRVRAGMDSPGASSTVAASPAVTADEYNSSGSDVYRPDYASEEIPIVVPVFEDMEVDYSTNRGFTPMSDPYAQKSYSAPVYTPESPMSEKPLSPTPIYQDPMQANPEYNARSKSDYVRDEEEESFVYVPHFDDDDPIPAPVNSEPAVPHWKLAKMRRRKVRRRSRRGMLFKLKSDKFADYTQALNS